MTITITPALPYFVAAADCDWAEAERIARDLGEDHVEAVLRAAALAEAEALLDDMDDGWESVAPDSDSDYLQRLGLVPAACIRYRDGTYECSDAEARSAARAELRGIIRSLSSDDEP